MEGHLCSESGCSCSDFLPFECSLCGNMYCLEHRSRFSHTCAGLPVEYEKKTAAATLQPSVKDMMSSVENRFSSQATSGGKQHIQVKTSTKDTLPAINNKSSGKITALGRVAENSASSRERKISMKAKEMLIKSKATGNDSIAGKDRLYLSVHFTDSLDPSSADTDHKVAYFFFSQHRPLGEIMQQIWQKHQSTVEQSASFINNVSLHSLPRENLSLVLVTADTPQWQVWDRNTPIKDCLSNYEDVAVFTVPTQDVLANQDEIAYVKAFGPRVTEDTQMDIVETAEEELPPATPVVYEKGQVAWYHKVEPAVHRRLSVEEMERTQAMIMVTIVGVHHDDYPNVYYTVKLHMPITLSGAAGCENLMFHTEKQTDWTHLLPVSESFGQTSRAASSGIAGHPTNAAGIAAAERSERANAAKYAAEQLQQTLCAIGKPVTFKAGFSNRDYELSIGSDCTVAQLKLLISAITEVPVPDMKLICKGVVLKDHTQLIKNTKISNGTKVVVMSSAAHVV